MAAAKESQWAAGTFRTDSAAITITPLTHAHYCPIAWAYFLTQCCQSLSIACLQSGGAAEFRDANKDELLIHAHARMQSDTENPYDESKLLSDAQYFTLEDLISDGAEETTNEMTPLSFTQVYRKCR